MKTAIKHKHRVYNKHVKRGRRKADKWENVRMVCNKTSAMITNAKDNYFAFLGRKLSNPVTGLKTYWTTLNKVINKKKVTNIPPLLEHGIFVTNFQTKADILNDFFVQQCSLHINNSVLPDLFSKCDNRFDDIEIDPAKVLTIICSLDLNKAHCWDNLSISMIKFVMQQFLTHFV